MKRLHLMGLGMAVLAAALWANPVRAEDKADKKDAAEKTDKADKKIRKVSGKSDCATCSGITSDGHQIMLVDKDGMRWVLIGDSESYKKAHEVRDEGKKMTATLKGEPVVKKDKKGKEYKEVKVTEVKIEQA